MAARTRKQLCTIRIAEGQWDVLSFRPGEGARDDRLIYQFEDENLRAVRFIKAVDGSDVWLIESGEDLRLAAEAGQPFWIVREGLR